MNKQFGNMRPRTVIGLALVALAILLFLNNIGIKLLGVFFGNWPLAMVFMGAALLLTARKRKELRPGALPYVLIGLGVVSFMMQHGLFNLSFRAIIVPLALVAGGLYLLGPDNFCNKGKFCGFKKHNSNDSNSPETSSNTARIGHGDKIDVFSVLGGGNYSTRSKELKSGNVLCVLGGAEIDISDADMKHDEMVVDVLAFMGGAEIKIPPTWDVTLKVLPLLGGVSNKTTCLAEKMGLPRKHLIITGVACMGGLELRN